MRVRGIELETRVSGSQRAPALFWGHALMGNMEQEDEAGIMPWLGLDDRAARLIRWDARGHGASEATLDEEGYRWSELARDLWAIADTLDLDQAIIGGVSMGAGTALHAALMAQERTRGLVLMAPPTGWDSRARQASLYRTSAWLVDRIGLTPFRWMGELAAMAQRNTGVSKLQSSVMRGLRSADPRSVCAALRGAALSDLPDLDALQKLDVPILILAWPHDPSHPLSTARALGELPNASLEIARSVQDVREWPLRLRAFVEELT
jgi:3-oxoadipate enol-lactonase